MAGATAHDLRAVVADLRFLQGYLASYRFQVEEQQKEVRRTSASRILVELIEPSSETL